MPANFASRREFCGGEVSFCVRYLVQPGILSDEVFECCDVVVGDFASQRAGDVPSVGEFAVLACDDGYADAELRGQKDEVLS